MPEVRVVCPDAVHVPRHGKPTRKRVLAISTEKNIGYCFVCGVRVHDAIKFAAAHNLTIPGLGTFVLPRPDAKPALRLPPEFTTEFQGNALGRLVWRYLTVERRLSPMLIAAYGIGYALDGRYGGRVILPVYDAAGTLLTFQARDVAHAEPTIKYMAPDRGHEDAVFNLARAAASGVILVAEGIFDALRCPTYAIALLGKRASARHRGALLAARPRAVVLALDDDAEAESAALRDALVGLVPRVLRYRPRDHDLGAASDREIHALTARLGSLARVREGRLGGPDASVDGLGAAL